MKKGARKRWLSIILAIIMVFSGSCYDFDVINTYAAEVELTEETAGSSLGAADDYGLADKTKDGVILHAWNWSFKQIQAELPKIAEAGFTAVQTSPIQPNKNGKDITNTEKWWKFYQPVDFAVCENQYGNVSALGTKAEFTELCTEAHKYGIKIIVDVVANHMACKAGPPESGAYDTKSNRFAEIPAYIRNNDSFWHYPDDKYRSSDNSRKQMTRGHIGMPDLNTGNKDLQKIITDFLSDAQKCGADGFRFDAAKHIETPSDGSYSSQFWAKVESVTKANDPDVFLYGEILNSAGPDGYNDIKKYTPYIKVTNNLYGDYVKKSVKEWNADYVKALSGYDVFGKNGNEWVLWNESHDTYAGGSTKGYSDEQMIMAWCAVAARYPTALYFVRPTSMSASLGSHKTTYQDKRIAAINKFHNYFAGQKEYASVSDNVLVVERGTTGVALVNYGKGSKSVSIKMNRIKDGDYIDQVTGNKFKVEGGTLKGKIGSGGVAAIYNVVNIPISIFTANPATATEGSTVKLTAVAESTEQLQYRFTVTVDGKEKTIQDYSTSNECNWNVSVAGTYTLTVYVKDGNGNKGKKAKDGFVVDHRWNNGVITKQATKKEDAVKTFTCTVCGKTRTQTVSGSSYLLSIPATVRAVTDTSIRRYSKNVKGSVFRTLLARTTKNTNKSITLKWKKVPKADGYKIYGNRCGNKKRYKLIKDVGTDQTSFIQKKLKKGTYYKYVVAAYKVVDGKKVTIAVSKTVYAATTGGKYSVAKSVKVNKGKVTLKKGKTFTIKATEVKANKAIKRYRKIGYESSNTKIATVSKKGVIKAKKKGTCFIYVYAQNGVYKRIKVTVK